MQVTTHNPIPLQLAGVPVVVDRANIAAAGETPDTTRLTQATAEKMRAAIVAGAQHPNVVAATVRALNAAGVEDWRNHQRVARAVWEWVRRNVEFREDEAVLVGALGMPGELELLITPPVLLSMDRPAGDCDDFAMLTGAMLLSAGIPRVEVTTIKADPTDPNRWSHVYLTATLGDGGRVVMDCSHGQWFGWEAPQYYDRTGWGGITAPAAALRYQQRATAQTKDRSDRTGQTPMQLSARSHRPGTPGAMPAGVGVGGGYGQPYGMRGVGVHGMGAVDWGAFTTQITTGALDIVKQVTQKPGQFIQTSGGVISSQVPGAAPYPGGGFSLTTPVGTANLGTGLSNTTLMVGGAVVLGLLVFAMGRRR